MTDADKTLDAFFADDGLPAHDQAFTHAVMRRAARRRLHVDLLSLAGVCLLAGLVLWAVAPGLQAVLSWAARMLEAAGPALGVIGLVVSAIWLTAPRARPDATAAA